MGSQLQGSPRRLQSNTEEHTKHCISEVISENLVSTLRPAGQCDLTLGFLTCNEEDTLNVITQFASHEKALADPKTLRSHLRSRLQQTNGNVEYRFPEEIIDGRYLLMECPTVSVEQCGHEQYAVTFGRGFKHPELCRAIHHPALPIKKLFFEPESLSHCDGLMAVSEIATVRALHTHLAGCSCTIDPEDPYSLVFEHQETSYAVIIEGFKFESPATSSPLLKTAQGLSVIPHPGMQIIQPPYILSVSIAPKPRGTPIIPKTTDQGVAYVGSIVENSMGILFGKSSARRILSISDFVD